MSFEKYRIANFPGEKRLKDVLWLAIGGAMNQLQGMLNRNLEYSNFVSEAAKESIHKKLIYIVGRDDWKKSAYLDYLILNSLAKSGYEIAWESPVLGLIFRLRCEVGRFKFPYRFLKLSECGLIKWISRIMQWFHCYFQYGSARSLDYRCRKLAESIRKLGGKRRIVILSYSSGGRASSLVADGLDIRLIICLGYPFKHPKEDPDPERYSHLADLKTPMLIIQGERDEYGGLDITGKYPIDSNTELYFVKTDHQFKITSAERERILGKIRDNLEYAESGSSGENRGFSRTP